MPNTTPQFVAGQVVAFDLYGFTTYAVILARDANLEPMSATEQDWIYTFAEGKILPESRLRALTALEASGT